jgi:Zn-dependent peptidase ImmA (M78 family)
MELVEQTLNGARSLLQSASDNSGALLPGAEIEPLALRIAFTLNLQSRRESHLGRIIKGMSGSPSLALATSMGLRVRDALKVGDTDSLPDLPTLLSEKLHVNTLLLNSDKVPGGCVVMNSAAFIVLPPTRRLSDLFVCAHELGHLLLLTMRNTEGAVFTCFRPRPVRSPYEHFADAFARELLIPARGVGIAIREIRRQFKLSGPIGDIELLYLSRIFCVSFRVMGKRCESLGLLPKGGALALHKILVEKCGGPEQRADELQLPPRAIVEIASVPYSVQISALKQILNNRTSKKRPSSPDQPLKRTLI